MPNVKIRWLNSKPINDFKVNSSRTALVFWVQRWLTLGLLL